MDLMGMEMGGRGGRGGTKSCEGRARCVVVEAVLEVVGALALSARLTDSVVW